MKLLASGVEYDAETKEIMMLRCPKCGRENYVLNVMAGICAWCGYDAHELLTEEEK